MVTNKVKYIDIPVYFLQKKLAMVFLFPNMKIIVSFWKIFAPNHVQVQLSFILLNLWPGSDSIHSVIQNTITSWYYTIFCELILLRECIIWSHVLCLALSVSTSLWIRLHCVLKNIIDTTKNVIDIVLLCAFP